MNPILNNPEKFFTEDKTFNKYFQNVCDKLKKQYNDPTRKYRVCDNFYDSCDCSAIEEARGYGVSWKLFKPTRDRLNFHTGDMDDSISYTCCFDEGSWYDDGYHSRKHCDSEKKEHQNYMKKIASVFESKGLGVVMVGYNVDGKGYMGVNSFSIDDIDFEYNPNFLVFVYI